MYIADIKISRDLPDDMSPYVFFIVFNDTTFIPYNRNQTSHVNTHALSLLQSLSFPDSFIKPPLATARAA